MSKLRDLRGDEIPRLIPGFVLGSNMGGGWQNNNLGTRDPLLATSFMEQDDGESFVEPTTMLNAKPLDSMDSLRRLTVTNIHCLEDQLVITNKLVTSARHEQIGSAVLYSSGKGHRAPTPLAVCHRIHQPCPTRILATKSAADGFQHLKTEII